MKTAKEKEVEGNVKEEIREERRTNRGKRRKL